MEQSKIIDTLETYQVATERTHSPHHIPLELRLADLVQSLVISLQGRLPKPSQTCSPAHHNDSWCTMSFVNIVRSYDVSPSLSCCDELSFPFEISFLLDWILLWIWEHLMYLLLWIPVVTMGYHIDSLDVCLGTQLADSRGDIGVIYA